MSKVHEPWAMFHSTDMGENLEEVVETEDCKVLRMKDLSGDGLMSRGYAESYQNTVDKTKILNDAAVEWMRRCNIYFCLAMSIFPATMIAVLPIGGLLFRAGTLEAYVFIQVILFSVGLLASLITVISYGDDLAKLGTIIGEVTDILEKEEQTRKSSRRRRIAAATTLS